jgi:carboxypeptidase family protein
LFKTDSHDLAILISSLTKNLVPEFPLRSGILREELRMRNPVLFVLLSSVAVAVHAQTLGSITGEVTDPSGAILPNAPVTVTNIATNASRSTTRNSAGIYLFPDLVPGTYQVKVEASGFEPQIKTNVILQVQQTARVDFTLSLGQATQTVEVSAAAAALTTEDATVGTVIESQRIQELPLNGRNFFQLVALSPNVTYGFAPAALASG